MRLITTTIIILFSIVVHAQVRQIRGYVLNEADKNPILFAYITNSSVTEGTYTDERGYFQLMSVGDSLSISALGYETQRIAMKSIPGSIQNIILLRPSVLKPILVKATRLNETHMLTPSVTRLKEAPVVLGQTDIIKGLTIYPGIAGGREGLAGIQVRGGNDDQNLYLLDGVTIYNPGHFFGFLSAYSPNVVATVNVQKDYIKGKDAVRLSSIIDVTTQPGTTAGRRRSREVGLLNLSYTDEGAFRDTTVTYGAGLRLAHTAILTLASLPGYLAGSNSLLFAGMYDANFKVVKSWKNGRRLTASVYSGDDFYGLAIRPEQAEESGDGSALLSYGNHTAALHFDKNTPLGARSRSSLLLSHYRSGYRIVESVSTDEGNQLTSKYKNRSNLLDLRLKHHLSGNWNGIDLRGGGEIGWFTTEPSRVRIEEFGLASSEQERSPNRSVTAAGSADLKFGLGRSFVARFGVRAGGLFFVDGQSVVPLVSPRISLTYQSPYGDLSLSAQRTVQELHSVNVAAGGLPGRIWFAPDADLPPQLERGISLSLGKSFSDGSTFYLAAYTRELENQVYLPTFSLSDTGSEPWKSAILSEGKGRAYGIETFVELPLSKRLLGSFTYTYSRSFRRFRDFNNNEEFPYDFDRPHDLLLSINWDISPRWTLASTFTYQTGIPYSQGTATILGLDGFPESATQSYNNGRIPDHHRLDFQFIKRTKTRSGKDRYLKIGLYNAYGRKNSIDGRITTRGSSRFFTAEWNEIDGLPTRQQFSYLYIYRFLPMFSYEVRY